MCTFNKDVSDSSDRCSITETDAAWSRADALQSFTEDITSSIVNSVYNRVLPLLNDNFFFVV